MRPSSASFDAARPERSSNMIGSGRMRPSAVLDVDRPERSCCRLLCTAKGRVLLRYAAYTLSKRVVVIFAAIALTMWKMQTPTTARRGMYRILP